MKNEQKKSYMISRVIIAIGTFIIFTIIFINEDNSWNILPFIFSIIAFALSFPSSIISEKLLTIGDSMQKRILKFLYYSIVLPSVSILIIIITYFISHFIYSFISTPKEFGTALSQTLFFLFIITTEFICIILPYIQTLLVLIIKNFIKD